MKLTCILLLTLVTFGCGTYNNMNPAPGAVSVVSQIMPTSAPAGGSGFVLTVDGTNFGMGSVIYWIPWPTMPLTLPDSKSQP